MLGIGRWEVVVGATAEEEASQRGESNEKAKEDAF